MTTRPTETRAAVAAWLPLAPPVLPAAVAPLVLPALRVLPALPAPLARTAMPMQVMSATVPMAVPSTRATPADERRFVPARPG